ncbi:restriction endonuclease subunit S [Pseudomonas sp. 2023EL-01195]|uniref:restriction endonuclease subunit S n=1 Tax=Pseudomonas sp. 2023EL-01195 TaxID=3088134 RepID=UPI00296AF16A|nr:restriction endonuclease subunit S [Pseudomonas sp. 2023EL-01195]MDW3714566.1 restriction endonuclease subunit S [Pseudomonas sp. 2023EL-01195]
MQPLGSFVTLVSGNTPSKSNSNYWGGDIPWISAKDMGDFWISDSEDHLTPDGASVASRLVPPGSVLLLTRGMTLHKRVPICRTAKPATFNQDVKAVLPRPGVSSRFVPYLLVGNHDRLHAKVDSAGHGTGRLNTEAVLSFPVWVPDLKEQERIADVGESLDDRITLLRETNATLEAIAQALFKSWFVDFDPVRAKAEGRQPEGMDPTTAALFPDSFEESELGLVPKGWTVMPIGEAVECVGGGTPDTKNEAYWQPEEFSWSSPKDLSGQQSPVLLSTERKLSAQGLAKVSSGLLPSGTLLMSSRAPIGYLAIAQIELAVNQGYIAMLPGGRLPVLYLLFWCRMNMEVIKGRANGSTFMEISKKAFRPIPALVPSAEVLAAFEQVVGPLFERLVANERQAQTLTQLRDTLLPRLISGQLRLPEAEQAVEEAQA